MKERRDNSPTTSNFPEHEKTMISPLVSPLILTWLRTDSKYEDLWPSVTSWWWRGTPALPQLDPGFPFPRSLCWQFGWTSRDAALTQISSVLTGQPSCRRRRRGRSHHFWRSASGSASHMSTTTKMWYLSQRAPVAVQHPGSALIYLLFMWQ